MRSPSKPGDPVKFPWHFHVHAHPDNLGYIRPGDRGALAQFRELLGLSDTGAGPETPFWRERDFILYRSGGDTILAVEDSGEALEFTSAGRSLSDHPALFARFDVDYVTEWDEDRDD